MNGAGDGRRTAVAAARPRQERFGSKPGPPPAKNRARERRNEPNHVILCVLWTRHGTDFTARLPRIADAVRTLPVDSALIDGEAVVFRPDGHSDFEALLTKRGAEQASFVAFDLLRVDGQDIRRQPLEVRRADLEALVASKDSSNNN